ncbi:hypothetical protein [Paenibacillus lautus]|nr:hypothetical protein [Paenibacillus lautus]
MNRESGYSALELRAANLQIPIIMLVRLLSWGMPGGRGSRN